MRLATTVCAIAGVAVIVACTDHTPLAPRSRSNGIAPFSASRSAPLAARRHPNSEKYRDSGFKPGTASSGAATVSVRALLDKSGQTDIEVTTGSFDGGTAPGTLQAIQVKAFTPLGKLVFTDNHTQLSSGGTASLPYSTLPHGTYVQVQSVVSELGSSAADVVMVPTNVYFRPDLVAWQLDAPASVPVGAAVNLQGYILERVGELGGRADCVLYVDGTAVDRANGIWVDANGFVACAMTHVFTEARAYALELRVENVGTRDFDADNNRVSATLTAVAPSPFSTYSFQAWDITDVSWWHSVSTLTQMDGTVETWDQIYTREGPSQFASISGLIPRLLDYSAPIRLRGEMSTNGAIVNTVDDTYGSLPWVDWQRGYCDSRYNFATRAITYICVHTEGYLAGYTYVQYDWSGANVHYTSNSYVYYWDPSGQLHESWYSDDYSDVAPMVTMGPDFSGRLAVQAAADAEPVTAQATITFEPVDLFFDYVDPLCSSTPAPPGCFELHGHTFGLTGFVSFGSWPPFTP